jgi:hypothetical protein
MRHIVHFITGLFFMLLIFMGLRHVYGIVSAAITGGGVRGLVLWRTDWNEALADAAAQHKRVLVEFARESSLPCRELAKKSWSRMDIVNAASDYVPVLVDMDAHPELVKQYQIQIVPSLVVIDARSGEILNDGRDCVFSSDELLVWLKPDAKPRWDTSLRMDGLVDSQKGFLNSQKSPFAP